jgi:hypothetical protein
MKTKLQNTKKVLVISFLFLLVTTSLKGYAIPFNESSFPGSETSGLSECIELSDCLSAPIAFEMWGSGEYCGAVGFEFGINNSETDVTYYLYQKVGDERFLIQGAEQTGTGGQVVFYQEAGEYFILGKNACDSTWMLGSANVMPYNAKTYIAANTNDICVGTQALFKATPERNDNQEYSFLWSVNGIIISNSGKEFSYTPSNGDQVSAIMSSPCFDAESNNTVIMLVKDCLGNTTTWTGNSGNDWDNPLNWSNGVPGPGLFVNIPGGLSNYPTLSHQATCESLIVEDGGSFIGSEFLNLKSAMVKRNISSPEFHFLSSPMSYPYPAMGGVFPANQQNIWARSFQEFSGNWINQTLSTLFLSGEGYSIQSTLPQTTQFIGLLNRSDITNYLYYNNPDNNANYAGWNLMGNPFTSAINWNQVIISMAEQAVYVWNGSQYVSWNGTIGSLTDGIIPAQSGFFVKAIGPYGFIPNRFITIPLSARVHSNQPFLKQNVANTLEIEVSGDQYKDLTFIRFNKNATKGFDLRSDARKLFGIEEAPQLFSFADGMEFSINELPFFGSEVIQLGFKCGESGTFILNAMGLESFNNKVRILLEDQKEGILQDLSTNQKYSFNYIAGESEHRFKLHFTEMTPNPESAEVNIYSVGKTVIVNNFTGLNGEIHIYDFTGRMILNNSIDSGNQSSFKLNTAAGPYIVKVITAKGVQSQKVVII